MPKYELQFQRFKHVMSRPPKIWLSASCDVLWFGDSPAISKRLEKRMMDFVVLLRSDQNPKIGPVSSPLRLKADRPRPRKYGGASKIWRYLHIVGRMTAETIREGWRRKRKICKWQAWFTHSKKKRKKSISVAVSLQPKCQTDSPLMRPLSHVFKSIKLS